MNVSIRQFRQRSFVADILETLARETAEPHLLKLELTESLLMDDVEDVIDTMNALKSQGISFSLADFGTGYSSLAYLKRLPLDQLKIDQSFVRDLLSEPNMPPSRGPWSALYVEELVGRGNAYDK